MPSEPRTVRGSRTGLFGALRAGEIHKVELGVDDLLAGLDAGLALDVKGEDAVRPRGRLVQLVLRNGAVGLAFKEMVERFLLVLAHVRRESLHMHSP